MMLVIRISGIPEVPDKIEEALYRLRLRKKYTAVLIKSTEENLKLVKKLRDYVAYGTIEKETLEKLVTARAQGISGKKFDIKKVLTELDKKNLADLGVKPFFRLHPPRKGIESKKHFGVGKGVLGDNKENINKLVERML